MSKNTNQDLLFLAQNASDSRLCKHIYLRGNYQNDMFYDKVDKVNVWNRMWLAAVATGITILSAVIVDNHFHITALLQNEGQESSFMHYFRLSITQYHNRRYKVHGTLGTRVFKRATIHGVDDLKDCICYHIRNVLHHEIFKDFMNYSFSTGRCVYDLSNATMQPHYNYKTLPDNLARAYLPIRQKLPKDWSMTRECMIIPPTSVFRADILETLFGSKEEYITMLQNKTNRESQDRDEPLAQNASHSRNVPNTLYESVVQYINENARIPIPSMTEGQKMEAIYMVKDQFPKVSLKSLERLFGIPSTTLRYRLKIWHKRE